MFNKKNRRNFIFIILGIAFFVVFLFIAPKFYRIEVSSDDIKEIQEEIRFLQKSIEELSSAPNKYNLLQDELFAEQATLRGRIDSLEYRVKSIEKVGLAQNEK